MRGEGWGVMGEASKAATQHTYRYTLHVHTCMYTHACTHIHVQIHMYMYMYTYTCTHTCTHTCTVQVFIKTGPLHTWSGGMHMTMLQCVGETSPSCRYLDQRSMNTASPAVLWVVD